MGTDDDDDDDDEAGNDLIPIHVISTFIDHESR